MWFIWVQQMGLCTLDELWNTHKGLDYKFSSTEILGCSFDKLRMAVQNELENVTVL